MEVFEAHLTLTIRQNALLSGNELKLLVRVTALPSIGASVMVGMGLGEAMLAINVPLSIEKLGQR
jgi:hypothetical protein